MTDIDIEAIRKWYRDMVSLRNDVGNPTQVECHIRDLLRLVDESSIAINCLTRRKGPADDMELAPCFRERVSGLV